MQAANHLEITCPPCAVDALPPELLWKIFMINTEREDLDEWSTGPWYVDDPDGRLDTARSCSQVCRLWRTLLLQFSSVWGRLLHIADFEHVADAWREVIIERIGDALLWVTGKITNSTRPFIMPILEKKWTNVQILVVEDEGLYESEVLLAWSFLKREAPQLEVITLWADECNNRADPRHILPFSPIFNNFAPRLKVFGLETSYHLSQPAPWLSNLYYITFPREQSTHLILSALKSMPLLRHLNISRNTVQHMVHINDGNLDKPHLPLLEHFWIDGGDPVTICLLLESITLPPGQNALQTLRLPTFHEMSQEGSQARERLHHAITKWIHSYMASFASPRLTLIDSEQVLSLIDVPQTEHEGMQVELPYSDNHSHFTIQSIANCPRLSFVEDLTVYLSSSPHWPLQLLYEALQSITYLTVGGPGMGTLFHDMQQFSLFPHLDTIEIFSTVDGTINDDRSGEESVIPTIIHFLEHRASIGRPLFMLDLSSLNIDGVSHTNLERLINISCLLLKLPGDDWDD